MFDIVTKIQTTQGSNAKRDLLKSHLHDETLKKVLFYTYNPFFNFYLRKIPAYKPISEDFGIDEMISLLDDLRNRVYTGNEALSKLSHVLSNLPVPLASLLKLMIGRDLKLGINVSSINKVFPKLIPTFDVMLADSGIDLNSVIDNNPWVYVQKKSDGKRCIAICHDGIVDFYARSGREIENLYKHTQLANSIRTIASRFGDNIVLDGELIIENPDGSDVDRQVSNGMIQRKDLTDAEIAKFVYVVWDIIPYQGFVNDNCQIPYEDRYYNLIQSAGGLSNVTLIPTYTSTTVENIMYITNTFMSNGFEGSIVKTPHHLYRRKRSKDWIKIKDCLECDLVVTGYKPGKPGSKYEGMLGSLMCQSSDGEVQVDVGSGLSDEQRTSLKEEDVIGKIVSVQYNQFSIDANGKYSLYLPRLVEFRDDKTVADNVAKIKKNG